MCRRDVLNFEKIRFFANATKLEKKLMRREQITEMQFYYLFDRMTELECIFMQMQLIIKHFELIKSELTNLEAIEDREHCILAELKTRLDDKYTLTTLRKC